MACQALASQANTRLKHAYVPKTWQSYRKMFCTLLTFCIYIQVDVTDICVGNVLMFLHQNGLSTGSIRNYFCGITAFLKWFDLDYQVFSNYKVSLMFKALDKTAIKPTVRSVFTLENVVALVKRDVLPYSQIYKTLYVFAYLGFLHISNCVPPSKNYFRLLNICVEEIFQLTPIPLLWY